MPVLLCCTIVQEFYFRRASVKSYIARIRSIGYLNGLVKASWGVLHA